MIKSKSIVAAVVEQIALLLSPFIVNIYLSTHLELSRYGDFYLAYTLYTFLVGVNQALFVEAYGVLIPAKYSSKRGSIFSLIFGRNLVAISIGVLTVFVISGVSNASCLIDLKSVRNGLALLAGIALPTQIVKCDLYIRGRIFESALLAIIGMTVSLAIFLWMHSHGNIDEFSACIVLSANYLPYLCAGILTRFKSDKKLDLKSVLNYQSDHIQYSKWVLLVSFVFQLYSQNAYWVAKSQLGSVVVAKYRLIQNIILPLNILSIALSNVSIPLLAKALSCKDKNLAFSILRGNSFKVFLAHIIFGFLVVVVKLLSLKIFEDYFKNIEWSGFWLCLLASFITANGHILNDAAKGFLKPKIVLLSYLISGGLGAFVGLALANMLNLNGVCLGNVVSAFLYFLCLAVSLRRFYRVFMFNQVIV